MRKIFGLVIVIIAFTACSKDDNDDNNLSIEGIWKLTAFEVENAYDLNNDGIASKNILTEIDCYHQDIIFNADDTGQIIYYSYAQIELNLIPGTTDEYEYVTNCVLQTVRRVLVYEKNGNEISMAITSG